MSKSSGRTPANAPVASTFREALAIADPVERRAWLLDRFEDVYQQAVNRHYLNKHGDEIPNPDGATATKVLTVVLAASEGSPELEQRLQIAKGRLVDALEALPAMANEPSVIEQKRAILLALRDAATVAALKPNADVAAVVATLRGVAQVLGVGKDAEDDLTEEELQEYRKGLLTNGKGK